MSFYQRPPRIKVAVEMVFWVIVLLGALVGMENHYQSLVPLSWDTALFIASLFLAVRSLDHITEHWEDLW